MLCAQFIYTVSVHEQVHIFGTVTYLDINRAPAFVRKTLDSTLHSEKPTPFFARTLKRNPSPAFKSFNVASRNVSEIETSKIDTTHWSSWSLHWATSKQCTVATIRTVLKKWDVSWRWEALLFFFSVSQLLNTHRADCMKRRTHLGRDGMEHASWISRFLQRFQSQINKGPPTASTHHRVVRLNLFSSYLKLWQYFSARLRVLITTSSNVAKHAS